jgi:antitoxin CptB
LQLNHRAAIKPAMPAEPDARRKRLLWRASHRGVREMDLLLGGFVARGLDRFSDSEVAALEQLIDLPDQDLYAWITGQAPAPEAQRSALLDALIAFRP